MITTNYKLQIESSSCNFEILINDMFFNEIVTGDSLNAEFPINHFLHKGGSTLSIVIRKLDENEYFSADARFSCKIISKVGADKITTKDILEYKLPDFDEINKLQSVSITLPFLPAFEFPNLLLEQLEKLEKIEDVIPKAIEIYAELMNIFENSDAKAFIDLVRDREVEFSKIFYYPSVEDRIEEVISEFKRDCPKLSEDPFVVNLEKCKPKLEYYGKLISLRTKHNDPVIDIYDRKSDITVYYDFKLGMVNSKLKIVR